MLHYRALSSVCQLVNHVLSFSLGHCICLTGSYDPYVDPAVSFVFDQQRLDLYGLIAIPQI